MKKLKRRALQAKRQRYNLFLATQYQVAAGMLRIVGGFDDSVEFIGTLDHELRKKNRSWVQHTLATAGLPQIDLWGKP
ncbi:hypothetical protein [Paraburkholderia sp. BL10I2N1]|uniref:hypothetical protein n=1 Tax=Paraburkholderia sp. BL10I2N1 TaxID=1938796 RepID=UPI0010606B5F|nr:hypothetical protein [Paraburkholderia sp. BL10I2N1]TDN70460.1 hypothetical protein B0G77_3934 [Paraburkholderia sp. BL10I2N1]